MRKGITWPNQPNAAYPAMASRLQAGPHWRGVADPGRWTKHNKNAREHFVASAVVQVQVQVQVQVSVLTIDTSGSGW